MGSQTRPVVWLNSGNFLHLIKRFAVASQVSRVGNSESFCFIFADSIDQLLIPLWNQSFRVEIGHSDTPMAHSTRKSVIPIHQSLIPCGNCSFRSDSRSFRAEIAHSIQKFRTPKKNLKFNISAFMFLFPPLMYGVRLSFGKIKIKMLTLE